MKGFIEELKALGFGTDEPIDGADVVDCINTHWRRLQKTAKEIRERPKLNKRELAAVLTGLRMLQDHKPEDLHESLQAILMDGGIKPLSAKEIDSLCKRINR